MTIFTTLLNCKCNSLIFRKPYMTIGSTKLIDLFGVKWKMKVTQLCPTLCDPHGLYSPWNSPGQNTGVGSPSLLQEIFPTQESNLGLPHCRQIHYQLSHKVSPSILAWIAIPSPGDLPDPGFEPGSPVLQVDSLPAELSGKPQKSLQHPVFPGNLPSKY